MPDRDVDLASRRRRMAYHTAERHLGTATNGSDLYGLRRSRLTHASEDGATEADLMNLSGHEDRRTLKPSKEGTHRRLDAIDTRRPEYTPDSAELALGGQAGNPRSRALQGDEFGDLLGDVF